MSGIDELFPDATSRPAAAVPPTSPATIPLTTQAAAPQSAPPAAPPPAPRRRGVGVVAFVLGLLAIVGDLVAIIVAAVAFAGAVSNLGAELNDIVGSIGSVIGVVVIAAIAFFGGLPLALLAVILGLVAAIRNRGRVLGIFGVIFGLIILVGHIAILLVVLTASGNLSTPIS